MTLSRDSVFHYETDPVRIEQESFRRIRSLTTLSPYSREQQQVVMRVVHSLGLPEAAEQIRFSEQACKKGLQALASHGAILCDTEMVKQGLTKRMLDAEPLCFLNHPDVPGKAKATGETRTMVAIEHWYQHMEGSVVVIGNAPTALFRLLEKLQQGWPRPALIVGMPVGFVGAAESKQALWDIHQHLGIECITLLGQMGGSAVASASVNALLRCQRGEWY